MQHRATTSLLKRLAISALLSACALLPSVHASEMAIASQQALSRAFGEFRASRYVVFQGCDTTDCHFQEASKFGSLGPRAKFKVARTVIDFEGAKLGDTAVYQHNAGQFVVGGKTVAANFQESYTKEEENWLHAKARLQQLPRLATEPQRLYTLSAAMKTAFYAQHLDEAQSLATQLLALATVDDAVTRWRGDYIHDGHRFLGLMALQRGDVADAKAQLLASARVKGSPSLDSFGPSMALAEKLLLIGERQAVWDYLELCKQFWKVEQLNAWQQQVQEGTLPQFGANLKYGG